MSLSTCLVGCLQALKRIITVEYQYQSFMIAVGMSFVGVLAGAALEWAFRKISKRPYDLTNPFIQKDIMPVGNPIAEKDPKKGGNSDEGVVEGLDLVKS